MWCRTFRSSPAHAPRSIPTHTYIFTYTCMCLHIYLFLLFFETWAHFGTELRRKYVCMYVCMYKYVCNYKYVLPYVCVCNAGGLNDDVLALWRQTSLQPTHTYKQLLHEEQHTHLRALLHSFSWELNNLQQQHDLQWTESRCSYCCW